MSTIGFLAADKLQRSLRLGGGRSFWRRSLASKNQPDEELEHGKMVSEGGGSVSSYEEAKEDVKSSKVSSVVESIKQHAQVEMNTAKDMVKDIPEKAQETTKELKETAAVAGEAIKRDVEKLAQKAGVKSQ